MICDTANSYFKQPDSYIQGESLLPLHLLRFLAFCLGDCTMPVGNLLGSAASQQPVVAASSARPRTHKQSTGKRISFTYFLVFKKLGVKLFLPDLHRIYHLPNKEVQLDWRIHTLGGMSYGCYVRICSPFE